MGKSTLYRFSPLYKLKIRPRIDGTVKLTDPREGSAIR